MICVGPSAETITPTRSRKKTLFPQGSAEKRTIEDSICLCSIPPILHMCNPNLKVPALTLYQFFNFEPLHSLHPGMFKLLMITRSDRLCSTNLKSLTILTRSCLEPSFSAVRGKILDTINVFLQCQTRNGTTCRFQFFSWKNVVQQTI